MDRQLETTVWLTLEPQFRSYGGGDATGMTVSKMTKSKPKGGGPKIKLKLKMPSRAFAPLAPTVTIEVPEDALSWPEPEITVETDS